MPRINAAYATVVRFASSLLILLPAALAFLYVRSFGVNVPFFDQFQFVEFLDKLFSGTLGISDLFSQHNEHRILFPRVAMLLLATITKYNIVAELYLILTLFLVTLIVLFFAFRRSVKQGPLLFVPISFLLFSLRQHENMLWGFQLTFVLVVMSSVLAFYFIYVSADASTSNLRRFGFSAALLSATVATFSSAQGLFVWPTGLLQLVISPMQKSAKRVFVGVWVLIGTVEWIVYFIGFVKPAYHPPMRLAFEHPVAATEYFLTLLGSALFSQRGLAFTSGLVLAGLLVAILILIYKDGRLGEYSFWIALLSFSFLVLMSITVGRVEWGIDSALTSRYASFPILAVVGIYAMFVKAAFERTSQLATVLLIVLSGLLLLSVPVSYSEGVSEGSHTEASREKAAFILSTYESQPDKLLYDSLFPAGPLHSHAQMVREGARVLQKRGYNVFSGSRARALPPPPSELSRSPSSTSASIDTIAGTVVSQQKQPVIIPEDESFITVTGWAVDANAKDAAGGVHVAIDGKRFPAFYGLDRKDVADGFGVPSYRYSGFERAVPVSEIGAGPHELSITAVTKNRKEYYSPDQRVIFAVE